MTNPIIREVSRARAIVGVGTPEHAASTESLRRLAWLTLLNHRDGLPVVIDDDNGSRDKPIWFQWVEEMEREVDF